MARPTSGPEAEVGEPLATGSGRDERHGDHPLAHEVGVVARHGHRRHATHRVADEDERALGAGGVDDRPQVVGELVDRAVLDVRDLGLAVAALVPQHDAVAGLDERPALAAPSCAG